MKYAVVNAILYYIPLLLLSLKNQYYMGIIYVIFENIKNG